MSLRLWLLSELRVDTMGTLVASRLTPNSHEKQGVKAVRRAEPISASALKVIAYAVSWQSKNTNGIAQSAMKTILTSR